MDCDFHIFRFVFRACQALQAVAAAQPISQVCCPQTPSFHDQPGCYSHRGPNSMNSWDHSWPAISAFVPTGSEHVVAAECVALFDSRQGVTEIASPKLSHRNWPSKPDGPGTPKVGSPQNTLRKHWLSSKYEPREPICAPKSQRPSKLVFGRCEHRAAHDFGTRKHRFFLIACQYFDLP